MQGKLVLITGASTRIGAGIARYFASNGWDVALHSHQPTERLLPLCQALQNEYAVQAYGLTADFLQFSSANHLWKQCQQLAIQRVTPMIHCLVNNAALFLPDTMPPHSSTSLTGTTLTSARAHLRVNYHVPTQLTHLFAHQFRTVEAAVSCNALVINLLDADMHAPSAFGFHHYLESKRGLYRATMGLSRRYGAAGVRINAIAPGIVLKGVRQSLDHFQRLQQQCLLPTPPSELHIHQTIAFFLQNTAITGQTLYVDAGRHILHL